MIRQLTGTLIENDLTEVVLDVNGVGYGVSVPLSTVDTLPPPGNRVTLLTSMVVREDDVRLYGFATSEERKLFLLLTGAVSGVGPKLALNVLSSMSVSAFSQAVEAGDLKTLSKISGIGKRTAERMVVELRDKVSAFGATAGPSGSGQPGARSLPSAACDAIAALSTLGFKPDQAEKAVRKILEGPGGEGSSAESLIRKALAVLNG